MRVLLLLAVLVCGGATAADVNLAAASNLNQVLPALIKNFAARYPQYDISVSYGASGTLSQQISRGAPYDIFLSASPKYVDYLARLGFVVKRHPFARGKLVLYYNQRFSPPPSGLRDLLRNEVTRVVIANPEYAPYGKAAVYCFKYYGIYEKIKNKLIFASNVSQAAQMAAHGADAALIALPLAQHRALAKSGNYLVLPGVCNTALLEEVALINRTKPAQLFFNYLSSSEAAAILRSYGYETP